ncbi:MAG: winged helix DNA-binding domain-containing protein [Pyrinomonadaceae bacterium]
MNKSRIAQIRLANQQIVGTKFTEPKELVAWLGAVQAQDYGMAKWAVGLRLASATERSIEAAVDSGSIIRTHVLRPTWHFVAKDDIRWILDLTAPRVHQACAFGMRFFELDGKTLNRCSNLITRALEGGNHLTRRELMALIENKGIRTDTHRASHIMLHAELDQLVCSGTRRGKQFTYALFDERVPTTRPLHREDALAKLGERYFTSHGPAQVKDFAWWSGLTIADAISSIKMIESGLCSEKVDGDAYWMSNSLSSPIGSKCVRLLPAFDEFTVSYKDRSASITPDRLKDVTAGHAIFKPIVVVDGHVVGVWKRTLNKACIRIEYNFFEELKSSKLMELQKAANFYCTFEGKPLM